MKVMQISCADFGSVGKIMNSISKSLILNGDQSLICYADGAKNNQLNDKYRFAMRYEQGLYRRISYLTGLPYGFAPLATHKLIKKIKEFSPDVIHLHCPNGSCLNIYKLISWLNKNQFPLIITNHCEMFYTANCPHSYECTKWICGCSNCKHLHDYCGKYLFDKTKKSWNLMYNSFLDYKKIIISSVSQWIYERSTESKILGGFKNIVIENGIDVLPYYSANPDKVKRYREQFPLNSKIILFVTPYFNPNKYDNKGSKYVIDLANRLCNEDILFLIVNGDNTKWNIEQKNIKILGKAINEEELGIIYNMADLSIVLSKRETFSMVCAESLCSGTPVVGFKSGGPESISLLEFSEFCDYGDIDTLSVIVRKWIDFKQKLDLSKCKLLSANKFNNYRMVKEYINTYQELIKKRNL